jgi:hypothetical protein
MQPWGNVFTKVTGIAPYMDKYEEQKRIYASSAEMKKATDQRMIFLDKQITKAILTNKLSKSDAIPKIKKSETKTRHHRINRKHNRSRSSSCLTHIFHNVGGVIQQVDNLTTMENELFKHFQCHFSQASGTPFFVNLPRNLFGYGGHNNNAQQLHDGNLVVNDITIEMKNL